MRQRRAADDGHGRPVRRELARQPLDARGLHAGLALHRLRREGADPPDQPSTNAPARPPALAGRAPLLMMTWARPSARKPSVPGRMATHSSALAPVCDTRGSTCTNLGRTPAGPCRIRP